MIFPRLVYRGPAAHLLVKDEVEMSIALADGWFASVPEALAPKPAAVVVPVSVPDDNAPPTRDELELKAKELGIKFDGRTGDKKLADAIAAKLKD